MEKTKDENGGSVITWKIENFHCIPKGFVSDFYSPDFSIGTTHEIKWKFYICCDENDNYFFYLKNKDMRGEKTHLSVSYSATALLDSAVICDKCGVTSLEVPSFVGEIVTFFTLNNIYSSLRTLILRCYLRIISDNSLTVNEYEFRSVVEAEHRKIQYSVPNITFRDQKLFIPMPLECSLTVPFKITLSASKTENTLDMDIINFSENENSDVFLICKLSVTDNKGKHLLVAIHKNEFKKEQHTWRFPTPIHIKDIEKSEYFSDALSLNFEFLVSEHKSSTWIEKFSYVAIPQTKMLHEKFEKDKINIRDDFMCLYIERKFPDVEIIARGKKFPAHKTVLCARSPVFSAMFENNMQEKEKNVIEISDLDPDTVDRMLFFLYSEILQVQEWDSVVKLYAASDKYQIMTLKDKCSAILMEQLSVRNTCEALQLADMHCDSYFQNSVQDFVMINADKIFQSNEWKEFMNINSKVACQTMHKTWIHRMENQ